MITLTRVNFFVARRETLCIRRLDLFGRDFDRLCEVFPQLRLVSNSRSNHHLILDEFIQKTNEHIHLRTAHSKLMGYWMTEYGGLNEVTHIWQYGKLNWFLHRKKKK